MSKDSNNLNLKILTQYNDTALYPYEIKTIIPLKVAL